MPSLMLLLADPFLARAVTEQLEGDWSLKNIADWSELGEGDALLAEGKMLAAEAVEKLPPLVFWIAEPGETVPPFPVTEVFVKPLRLGFLETRLTWLWTAFRQRSNSTLAAGPYEFAVHRRELRRDGADTIKLTDKEADLLAYLILAGKGVSRDQLLAEVWGYRPEVDTHTLETHIYRLRSMPELRDRIVAKQGTFQWIGQE